MLTISNANPIQFWLTGEESFNQKEVCSIYPVCFCQMFRCDDIIKSQLLNSSSKTYGLKVYNGYSQIMPTIASVSSWSNVGSGTSWTNTPSVNLVGTFTTSKYWATSFTLTNGLLYFFNLTITVPSTINYFRIVSLDNSNNLVQTLYETSFSGSGVVQLTPTIDATKLAFVAQSDDAGGTESVTVNSFSLIDFAVNFVETPVSSGSKYEASFIPNNLNICGLPSQYQFKIYDFNIYDFGSSTEVAFSDCIEITNDDGNCTELIQYANSTNFARLDFSSTSPKDYFYLRVPAVFFEEDNPQEQEDLELSDDTIVTLWSKIEAKKTLDIGYMPFYMHLKLQLALMMDDVIIDGVPYRMRDPYQRVAPSSKRSALRRASVVLSQKDFIDRNLL